MVEEDVIKKVTEENKKLKRENAMLRNENIALSREDFIETDFHYGNRFIKDVSTEVLISEYKKAGHRITVELLNKYSAYITYAGIRARLIAAGVWAGREGTEPRRGSEAPHYLSNINTDVLVKDYEAAGHRLTAEVVSKHGASYSTLRARLVSAGEWKGERKK